MNTRQMADNTPSTKRFQDRAVRREAHRGSTLLYIFAIILAFGYLGARQISIPRFDVDSLYNCVDHIRSGDSLMLQPGIYSLAGQARPLVISGGVDHVAIIGVSPDLDTISCEWGVEYGIYIGNARHVTIENLRIQYPYIHPVFVHAEEGAFAPHFKNLDLAADDGTDCEQFIKVTTDTNLTQWCDSGLVEKCRIGFDYQAPGWYTNGVDIHAGAGWVIRDNTFENIRAPSTAGRNAGAAVLAWNNAIGTVVERNRFLNCDVSISMGDPSGPRYGWCRGRTDTSWDNRHAIVRNNFIWRNDNFNYGDVGITLNKACSSVVYNNTVVLQDPFVQSMDCRFRAQDLRFGNNLTDNVIWYRDGATADSFNNIEIRANPADWFVNLAAGNLHLHAFAPAVDSARSVPEVTDDIDRRPRWYNRPDIGADEYGNEAVTESPESRARPGLLRAWPNPVTSVLHLSRDRAGAAQALLVFNSDGRCVSSISPGTTVWHPAPSLPNGVYFIRDRHSALNDAARFTLLRR